MNLFPDIAPFNAGYLKVDPLHEVYFEESGNPNGKPALFVHGGPGGGTEAKHRRFWDPTHYRIVLFDQRGCGQSRPHACLEANTTAHLVADIEMLRTHLRIEKWQIFGGSWGSTLALAYAERHPDRVTELILRGIFLLRRREIDWFYQEGASRLFPDAWEDFVAPIPPDERDDLLSAYHRRLTGNDRAAQLACAKAWSIWEARTSTLISDPSLIDRFSVDEFALAFARIECHYFIHRGFLESDGQLLKDVAKIRHIPGVIVQGRYDVVCPGESAWALHRAWPEAEMRWVADAGHAASQPGITAELIRATEKFKELDAT